MQADKRSDIWAFGCVLYEMLSGQRAFKGDDVADTLAAVLRQDIDWAALPRVDARVGAASDGAVSRTGRQAAVARHRRSADRAGRSRRDRSRRGGHGRPRTSAAAVATRDSLRALRDRGWNTGRSRRVVPSSLCHRSR